MKKRLLSILLCLVMVVGLLPVSALADEAESAGFPYKYQTLNNQTAEKVSHPNVAPNSNNQFPRRADGVVNYAGNGKLDTNVLSPDAVGDRGESYSWSALGYGDWIYTGLLYNALWTTTKLMGTSLGYKIDPELLPAILNTIYNGDYFMTEEDGKSPGGALVKINTKTGEVVILMSQATSGQNVGFRNAVKYNGKFYFCGSVNGAPQVWQIDPKTDKCQEVYGMSIQEFGAGFQQGISSGIRGLCVYNDELIISTVEIVGKNTDGTPKFGAQIYSTTTPEDKTSYQCIATQEDLFNYPAFHFCDSIYGGFIWEIVEFNEKLYVSICTGTPENKPDDYTMQSFAIVCGEKDASGNWTWRPVVGDTAHGAKYTFGIDPERTRSGAAVLAVYNDALYIGEYNDEEIALLQLMFNLDFGFMNKNLEQSVSLYRMDKDEDIKLVVGDATTMFPNGGTSNIASGFGRNENQYFWRMTVYHDKLYCGTFDTSSMLEPVGQFVNGDMAKWTPAQWYQLFQYIRALLKITNDKFGGPTPIDIDSLSTAEQIQTREDIRELFDLFDSISFSDDEEGITEQSDLLANLFSNLPADAFQDNAKGDAAMLKALSETFADDEADAYRRGDNVDDNMGVFPSLPSFPSFPDGNIDGDMNVMPDNVAALKNLVKTMKKLVYLTKELVRTAQYMAKAERGCDIYVMDANEDFRAITQNGFGDPFNHGLRVYAETNNGLAFGTANPFYGTQWWLIREDNKPVEVPPKAPVATNIPTDYIVSCVTDKNNHASKQMNLLPDTFTIGEVTKEGNNYVCPITIATAAYAKAYSELHGEHTAVAESITFNMTWNGEAWDAPEMTQLPVIKVECKATEPEAPAETALPSAYFVSCTTDEAHADTWMLAIPGADKIGEVTKDGETYICPVTVSTEEYAKAYSEKNGNHTAVAESVTYNMTWDGQKWVAPKRADLPVIELKCEATKPETPKAPAETALPSAYLVSCTTNDTHADAWMLAIPGADTIGEVTKDGETYICPVTVSTKEYAEAYSEKNGNHTAVAESVTYNMTWNGQKWVAPNRADLPVIELKCEATKPDPKPDPKPETYTVTVVGSEASVTGAGKYEAGKLVTIDAGMRIGYTFAGWTTTQNDVTLANPYSSSTTFTMPKYDVTLTANWRLTPIVPTPSPPSVSNLYPIEILDTTNGAVTSSHKYASAGTTVTLTVNPAAGYTLGNLTAYTSNKVDLKLTDKGEGKYTFTMPASKVFVASVFNPVNGRFVDVPSGSYFEEAVNWAVANGITTGTSATTFDPDGICTRAQAVTFLWRAAGSPAPANSATPFTDVAADSYYAQAVAWAVENGITKGTSDTTFSPDAHCSRAQIVTFLWRAQKSPVVTAANPFADVSADAYYVNAIQWAVSEGVTTGTSAVTFSPDADCTRAQIVTFIWRALSK